MLMAAIILVFVGWKQTSLKLYIGGPHECLQTQTGDNIGAGWKVLWCGLTWWLARPLNCFHMENEMFKSFSEREFFEP